MKAILIGGLAAGVIDISYATLVYRSLGVGAEAILQSVASGLLGEHAFRGGIGTASLGLILHFLMTLTMALLFVEASRRLAVLRVRPVGSGIVYGLILYVVMNYIVVPLSAFPGPAGAPSAAMLAGGLAIHALGVGLPIALAAARMGAGGPGAPRIRREGA